MEEKMEDLKGVKMEVKMEVKNGVKMDNSAAGATSAVHSSPLTPSYNSNFNSNFNSQRASRSFRDLECWQKAHEFVKEVYAVTKAFPDDERYGLTSQFRRAAVSIAANICEGYKKLSRQDKLRFINIAQGSLEECRYYIILSLDIAYIDRPTHDRLEYLINGASWKLNGYAEGIRRESGSKSGSASGSENGSASL